VAPETAIFEELSAILKREDEARVSDLRYVAGVLRLFANAPGCKFVGEAIQLASWIERCDGPRDPYTGRLGRLGQSATQRCRVFLCKFAQDLQDARKRASVLALVERAL